MIEPAGRGANESGTALGAALEPALREACDGRLSPVAWFQSDWQRGGAATGAAEYTDGSGLAVPVVVKVPIGPTELRWMALLRDGLDAGDHGCPAPRVYRAEAGLAGHDLGWAVMERLPGRPLAAGLDEAGVRDLLAALVSWHELAARLGPPLSAPPETDWEGQIGRARDACKRPGFDEGQRWNQAIRGVQRALPVLARRWASRPLTAWCHGDAHPGNAMRRAGANGAGGAGACVLIDLALVHAGAWIEDALYLERVYWGRLEHLHAVNVVSTMAQLRRGRGLACDEDYALLANTRRVLSAACAPGLLGHEGNRRYLHGALEVIERLLPQVHR